jgi:MinD superfamily P-loop ATPase
MGRTTKITIPTIAVTGGKGGTGKSLIATNLAVRLSEEGKKVLLIDCDVENPNTNILLGISLQETNVEVTPVEIFKPSFNHEKCTKCGQCRDVCYRHAILQFPDQFPSVMDHMCSGCTTCLRVCPTGAIEAAKREIGLQYFIKLTKYPNISLIVGELKPTEAVSVLIIKEILAFAAKIIEKEHYDLVVIDTSPGAHCDVEEALSGVNLILCVTEPTPFGEHDLGRILDLVDIIGHKAYIILNRADMANYQDPIRSLAQTRHAPILGEIPLDNTVIEDYARGIPFSTDPREFPAKSAFNALLERIKDTLKEVNTQ